LYKVSFDLDGGSATGSATADQQVKEGGKATKPSTDPVKNGYVFTGWYPSKTATTEFNFTSTITGSTVIYAKWKEMCTITFDGQGATTPPVPATVNVNAASELGSFPIDPKRKGYVFDGWYSGTNGSGTRVTASMQFSMNTMVYAKWIIKDIDNNVYTEVKIGNQVWIVENLKTTKLNDGTAINLETKDSLWPNGNLNYCWFNNDSIYKKEYGALYNLYVVQTGKLAPLGWHVATGDEWTTLVDFVGGNEIAGKKLKEAGTIHWTCNSDATNEFGFSVLPVGTRTYWGPFNEYTGDGASWWTASSMQTSCSVGCNNIFSLNIGGIIPQNGFSVRCIRDD
jgi:uncharacterized protein (TIGR02145 family)/uncharacterized repeat protein (TIGR02543 family)